VSVFLDGKFAFSLTEETVLKGDLQIGQELSEHQIETLTKSDRFQRCLDAARQYLSYRPRSEAEIRQRLQQRSFDGEDIERVIGRLKEQGLVDDTTFAQFWAENREAFSPRSQRLTRLELRQKGVDSDIIAQVVATLDDEESAYRAALSKARRLSTTDYEVFRRRLGDYLRRRGFGYEVINSTVAQLWREREVERG